MARTFFWVSMGLSVLAVIYLVSTPTKPPATSPAFVVFTPPQHTPATVPTDVLLTASTKPVSTFGSRFKDHLMVIGKDGYPHSYNNAKLEDIKYWAFYYSASWCPPCRAFTPELVNFYSTFKPTHPDFELVLVSADNSDGDMVNYMKSDSMRWPAIWYQDRTSAQLGMGRYAGPGIPCLVLVDADGKVLSDSYRNGQYVGPHAVMEDINNLVR